MYVINSTICTNFNSISYDYNNNILIFCQTLFLSKVLIFLLWIFSHKHCLSYLFICIRLQGQSYNLSHKCRISEKCKKYFLILPRLKSFYRMSSWPIVGRLTNNLSWYCLSHLLVRGQKPKLLDVIKFAFYIFIEVFPYERTSRRFVVK